MDDRDLVAVQIGRPSRAPIATLSRCHLSLPVVVRVPPVLEDGTPFPTLYWLTCPLAVTRVSRLESGGGVKSMERRAAQVAEFGAALDAAHTRYQAQRDELLPPGADPRPTGGVAGARRGVKCLHAHYADARAGNSNPVGELVAPWVEPLDCTVPCIVEHDGRPTDNPQWTEPRGRRS
ncbi:MAG: DUF501 domain-containing protein [bacterium]|nr:DUF501 domain-containing protein [bacterium]MDE0288485.1 DUF501 domain-containing protein [bacterium]MDE0439236.1 DUF501 domain-containing protein [bacterium]